MKKGLLPSSWLMMYIYVYVGGCTGFVDPKDPLCNTKMLAPEALRGCGGLLVGSGGGGRWQ